MRLDKKIAVVTGAASGFGEGIARRFAAEGARVLIADTNYEQATRIAADIGTKAAACNVDVSRADQVQEMIDATLARFGDLDIVVNNAGYTHKNQSLLEVDETTFDRSFAVNVKSVYLTARAAVPIFRTRGSGVILNIASTAGLRPRPGLTWYNTSKGAMITATKSMAVELAPNKIRVNALCPVAGETPLLKTFMGEDTPERRAQFIATIPLGRFSTPSDIANAALFLVSDEAAMITGAALEVDGGRCV